MNSQQAISTTLATSSMVLNSYISDLSDEELFMRPADGCNHVAWQLGHLIASECSLLEMVCPGIAVKLPDGFEGQHSKEMASSADNSGFYTKQEYLDLFEHVHAGTLEALSKLSDADLDQPGPEQFGEMFPTVGHVFVLIATHGMMHAGQIVPVRRKLGKPVLF